ncbi:MAG: hypothetical protein M3119_05935 [Verrucomicrobiota bacterium]|nr:hypothetical protein [Verrucomicrobiota bacterium]MDQ6939681.1 hypothetical protein [Verrucomicrobiota bacterium]
MNREEDQELWDLLGKSAQPAISPFFVRNVVRQIRQQKNWTDYARGWLRPRRLIPASAVALVMALSAFSIHSTKNPADNPPELVTKIDPQDYDTVTDLDDLLTTDDDGIWTEGESVSL